jgi:Cu(I)/Ag(I) efflux system membrane fusion protein
VTTGERFGDRIEILSGLQAGDRVVASANFLVDSESQLKGGTIGGSTGGGEPASGGHEHHD